MLCADFLNTLYKLEINRTFIEHEKKYAIKKLKKYTNINMKKEKKIDPFGFREYDARWLFPESINELGIESVGKGFGTQVMKTKKNPTVIVGHDYRSYSENVKKNFVNGLLSTGCNVKDIGLCLSPTVYFSQFKLNSDAVAMITASHNENGWTGIKMGIEKGLTHCKDEMSDLKDIVLNEKFVTGSGKFEEIKIKNGLETFGLGTGAAVADIDGDGILELLVSHGETGLQPLTLYKADINEFNYLRIKPLTKYGAPARGATVTLKSNMRIHSKTIDAGSGYLCQMEPVAHYGIRENENDIKVEIKWTNGSITSLNIKDLNKTYEVKQN